METAVLGVFTVALPIAFLARVFFSFPSLIINSHALLLSYLAVSWSVFFVEKETFPCTIKNEFSSKS
jgi:hypothetical protein